LSKEKIVQFSVVVQNVERVAKLFADIFGIRWVLYDFEPAQILLKGKTPAAPPYLKIAIGNFGGRSLKLIQPVSGQNSWRDRYLLRISACVRRLSTRGCREKMKLGNWGRPQFPMINLGASPRSLSAMSRCDQAEGRDAPGCPSCNMRIPSFWRS
jgi:hypothetical protein